MNAWVTIFFIGGALKSAGWTTKYMVWPWPWPFPALIEYALSITIPHVLYNGIKLYWLAGYDPCTVAPTVVSKLTTNCVPSLVFFMHSPHSDPGSCMAAPKLYRLLEWLVVSSRPLSYDPSPALLQWQLDPSTCYVDETSHSLSKDVCTCYIMLVEVQTWSLQGVEGGGQACWVVGLGY